MDSWSSKWGANQGTTKKVFSLKKKNNSEHVVPLSSWHDSYFSSGCLSRRIMERGEAVMQLITEITVLYLGEKNWPMAAYASNKDVKKCISSTIQDEGFWYRFLGISFLFSGRINRRY